MAQVTLTIPTEQVDRIRAATAHRLSLEVEDVGVAQVQELLASQLKKIVLGFERDEAGRAARDNVTEVDVT